MVAKPDAAYFLMAETDAEREESVRPKNRGDSKVEWCSTTHLTQT